MTGSKAKRPLFRLAEFEDAPFVTQLLRDFYSKYDAAALYGIGFDTDSTLETVRHVIEHGLVLFGKSSCASAMFLGFPFNRAAVIAHVPFWYFRQPSEIVILEALLKICHKAGATHFNVAALPMAAAVERKYERLGLKLVERHWLGALPGQI